MAQIKNGLQTLDRWGKNCHVIRIKESGGKETADVTTDARLLQYVNEFINIDVVKVRRQQPSLTNTGCDGELITVDIVPPDLTCKIFMP